MEIYPKEYVPEKKSEKPAISASKKTALMTKVKQYMTENKGYYVKELINVVQAELLKTHIHIKDEEVHAWIVAMDKKWGWHPEVALAIEK